MRLLVGEERCNIGYARQRHDAVRIKRAERDGLLGCGVRKVAAIGRHFDADEVADAV
jgi:hypothetical protein